MSTKQKLRISNLVNFCFFILAFSFLLIKLGSTNITVFNTNLKTDLLYMMILLVIVSFMALILYLLPGLIITRKYIFISFKPSTHQLKDFKVIKTYRISMQHINRKLSVCRC